MDCFNRDWLSIVLYTSVIANCAQVYAAAIQENQEILADAILLPRGRHVRHVPVALKRGNRLPPSVSPPMIDLDLSEEAEPGSSETDNSPEINFLEDDDEISTWTSAPASSSPQSGKVHNHSAVSLELETNSSDLQSLNVIDFSELPSQSKIQRAISAENAKEVVVIDMEKDKAFDENVSEGSSKLWIYSNAICILLVVGVSIFLIYYPKKDRRKACKNSSESPSSSSSASSTA